MAIVDENSTQLANAAAVPITRNHAVDVGGKLRVSYFDHTRAVASDAGGVVSLVKLPPGRVRVFPGKSFITLSALGASRTVDIGYAAYVGNDGVAVAADPDYFWSAVDCSSAVEADLVEATNRAIAKGVLFQSRDGITITMTVNGDTHDVGETAEGFIVYATDT